MTAPTATPVPLLDVNRQNAPLRAEIDAALAQVVSTGTFVNGPACRDFEQAMAQYTGAEHAVGCASGSDALLLPLLAMGIGSGDEVILPSFTFFATAGAVWRVGAKPVFADILPESFNIDPQDVARKITPRTKAIIPVHLFGQCADMTSLRELASAHNLQIIEDAAQAIGSSCREGKVGVLGNVAAFSYYPTKNLGGFGDGGLMTTNDGDLAEQLRRYRNHGQHPRYYHHVVGINSRLDSLQAAVLNVKLKYLDGWAAARARIARRYNAEILARGMNRTIETPTVAPGSASVWNQYTVRVHGGRRDALEQFLAQQQIGSAVYYPVPLHLQDCFLSLGYQPGDLPHTERAAREVLSLPVAPELTHDEQTRVIAALAEFCASGVTQVRGTAVTVGTNQTGANVDLPSRKAG